MEAYRGVNEEDSCPIVRRAPSHVHVGLKECTVLRFRLRLCWALEDQEPASGRDS